MKKAIWIGALLIRAIFFHEIMYVPEKIIYYDLYNREDESIERKNKK